MKTVIVALASLIATVAVSGQTVNNVVTDQHVWEVIMKSKQANALRGVNDPNLIMPGQLLTFKFSDGFDTTYITEKGDNQCVVVRRMLKTMTPVHGQVVAYDTTKNKKQEKVVVPVVPAVPIDYTPLWWAIGLLLIALVLYGLYRLYAGKTGDPTTGGTRIWNDGITDTNRVERMQEIAQRQYPGQRIRVLNTQRGRISGEGVMVSYGGNEKPQRRTFKNVPGVQATILVGDDPTPKIVYGLLACANDVRLGNYFTGKLTFVPDEQPVNVVPPAPATGNTQPEENRTESETNEGMQRVKEVISQIPEMVNKVLEKGTGLNVTLKVTQTATDLEIEVLKLSSKPQG